MQNLKTLKENQQLIGTLKNMAATYEEIAVMRMQKIRDYVLYNRDFLKRVGELYLDVKLSYKSEVEKFEKSKNTGLIKLFRSKKSVTDIKKSFSTFNKNGKNISVLVTSNRRLIGPISIKVFDEFIKNIENSNSEILIIGKKGRDMYKDRTGKDVVNYFDYPESEDLNLLKPLVNFLKNFEKVDVFYGKFLNLINQVGDKMVVSGDNIFDLDVPVKSTNYLFEPSLFEVLNFFEVQIFSALFRQSIFESNLAVYGSQIQAMESTSYNSEKELISMHKKIMRSRKNINNKKQIQRLIYMSLWS